MLRRVANFVLYHNGFTVLFVLVMLGSTTVLAANEDIREQVVEVVVSAEENVVSVDNSYIIEVDLDTYTPRAKITAVEEDDLFYYVTYELETISLVDGAWSDTVIQNSMQVDKEQLGGADLGLHVAADLDELLRAQVAYLKEVQEIESQIGSNEKVVERTYAGLVGQFLEPEQEIFDDYDPVIDEPVRTADNNVAVEPDRSTEEEEGETDEVDNVAITEPSASSTEAIATTTATESLSASTTTADTESPVLTLNGPDLIKLVVGDTYDELGATATDDTDGDITNNITISGSVDVETEDLYEIIYKVVDAAGNEALLTRTVVVEAAEESSAQEDAADNEISSDTEESAEEPVETEDLPAEE